MSKAIFLCDIEIEPTEGIYKKVNEQARVISEITGKCVLFSKAKTKSSRVVFQAGDEKKEKTIDDFYEAVEKELLDTDIVYIRHMLPAPKQLKLIAKIKAMGCRLYYEIPTYPYFGEQIKSSPHKMRTSIRILVDVLAWPFIYSRVNKLVAIRSNTKVKIFKKMLLIPNGIAKSNIKPFPIEKHNNGLNLVVVGTLYPYHGIDRMLSAISGYYKNCSDKKDVFLHVVGSSAETDALKAKTENCKIPGVIFHGRMSTNELMDFYPQMDVGVGCLALYRRNADIDTTLKVVEYLCYGLPIVTSGSFPMEKDEFERIRMKVSNDDHPIHLDAIIKWFESITIKDRIKEQQCALNELTWTGIIKSVICADEEH